MCEKICDIVVVDVCGRSSHEIAHKNADEKGTKLRWPWEKLCNSGTDVDNVDSTLSRSVFVHSCHTRYDCSNIVIIIATDLVIRTTRG